MVFHLIYWISIIILLVLLVWQYIRHTSIRKQNQQHFEKITVELKHDTKELETHKKRLQEKVLERTAQVQDLNLELQDSNEKLQAMNEYLEAKIRIRTAEIEKQNSQITEYAFITSHQLRAPLARILGLIQIIEMEEYDSADLPFFIQRLANEGKELDEVIHTMNRKLEKQKERKKK